MGAMRYAVRRSRACRSASSTSRPRILFHLAPSGCSALRSQSSAKLAAPCFCVQIVKAQIPEHICPESIRLPLSGIVQPRSTEIVRHHFSASTQHPPNPQTAFHAHMPFEPPACERGHDTDYGKAGSGEEKANALCLHKRLSFLPNRKASAVNRCKRFLPAFTIYHISQMSE